MIIKFISEKYSTLLNIGISSTSSALEKKRSKVLNLCTFISLFTVLFFFCFDYFTQNLSSFRTYLLITEFIVFSSILYLHKKKFFFLSRLLFLLMVTIIIFIHANYSFRGFYAEYQYIIIPLLSLFFFDKKYIHYLILALSIVLYYFPNTWYQNYPDPYFGYLNVAFIFIGVFLIVDFFKRLNQKNEASLFRSNQSLVIQNKTIASQKLLLEKAYNDLEISKKNELAFLQLKSLRSQMNPHFIFNSLNSIQDLVLQQDTEASYDYIVLFAQLVRNTLHYSNESFISIEKEIEFLEVYLELEKLRFGELLSYDITFTQESQEVEIPSLLIQPFVENALIHGLFHKKGNKKLHVHFELTTQLKCFITDNGVGRTKAKKIQKRQGAKTYTSFALEAIKKRLHLLQDQYGDTIGYTIIDLYDDKQQAIGTKVEVILPFNPIF
ncbi:histidine kinase [Aquimarina sp. TRL1]|uniref:sensor histidine kinase n=1 Tax=Aquimarina sp. (strain TRL1) TaxID=2736252 RepID=UPI0015883168|nr:histidine kinase [Aquimarina sp. TRL1]QKX06944.1 histidine kinase [Aquimarina sp. TRL1]